MMPLTNDQKLILPTSMRLTLHKKPKGATIIEAFPGFGLIGTIATEFLLNHMDTEKIGNIELDEVPPMIAIHQSKLIEPISIHYSKKHNIVFVHSINSVKEAGWHMADIMGQLAQEVKAKEIVCLEGVGSARPAPNPEVYFYTTAKNTSTLSKLAKPLTEGIIVGVTGALLVRQKDVPVTALFAETMSNLPDSKGAARIIEILDKYFGLQVDYQPLLKQAENFEKKLKKIMHQSTDAERVQKRKELSYVG